MKNLLWIGLAGAFGALARYGLSGLVQRRAGEGFPWGTLAVNLAGCFVFGLVWAVAENRLRLSGVRTIVLIGFVGAFTTFSTFAFETGALLDSSKWPLAAGNIFMHCAGGLLLLFAGMALGARI